MKVNKSRFTHIHTLVFEIHREKEEVQRRQLTTLRHEASLLSQVIDLVVIVLLLLPESEVLFQEFNDGLGITEVVLLELINLFKSILECLVSKIDGFLLILHDFIVEDRKVEGKTKLDRITRLQRDLICFLVLVQSCVLGLIKLGSFSSLADVPVVVTNHLDKESLGLQI